MGACNNKFISIAIFFKIFLNQKSREMISHLKEHTNKVTQTKLIEQDTHLLSSSRDRALLAWDLKREKRVSAHY